MIIIVKIKNNKKANYDKSILNTQQAVAVLSCNVFRA